MGRTLGCELRKGHRHSRHVLSKACKRTAGGLIETLERRVLLAGGGASDALAMDASVSGQVFLDFNQNGTLDAGEPGLAGWIVFADANANGSLDAGEASGVARDDGTYRISGLAPGSITLAVVPQDRWSVAASKTVTLQSGQEQKGVNFGNYAHITADRYAESGAAFRVDTKASINAARPTMARDDAGNFVVVWQTKGLSDNTAGIYAQRYNAAGAAVGGEICIGKTANLSQVPSATLDQMRPAVAMDGDGDFIVVWEAIQSGNNGVEIHARRYNAAGESQGDEFRVNTENDWQKSPVVAMDHAGNIAVGWYTWVNGYPSTSGYGDVRVRRYDSSGMPMGQEFVVDATTLGKQSYPALAMDVDGNLLVAWQQNGISSGIFGRRFDANGQPQGSSFCLKAGEAQFALAMNQDGSFAVAWNSSGVCVQRFNAAGIPQGPSAFVSQTGPWVTGAPVITASNAGSFMLAWTYTPPGSPYIVVATIDAWGLTRTSASILDSNVIRGPQHPALLSTCSGGFVVAWDSKYRTGITARRFEVVRPPDPVITYDTKLYIGRGGEDVWLYDTLKPNTSPWQPQGWPYATYPISELNTLRIRSLTPGLGWVAINLSQGNPIPAGGLFIEGSFSLDLDPAPIIADFTVNVTGKNYIYLQPGRTLGTLNLLDTSWAIINAANAVFTVNSLSIAPGASFELRNNSLVVRATPETRDAVLANVSGWIKSARAGGTWSGPGLTSSQAKTNKYMGLGVMRNDNGHGQPIFSTFQGQSVGVNDVLIKYTWNGDVNLDGVVDAADYFLVDSGFITQKGGYRNGDLNLDGVVDAADYFLIDSAFMAQTGTAAAEVAPAPVDDPVDDVLIVQAPPAQEETAVPVLRQLFAVNSVLATEMQDLLG